MKCISKTMSIDYCSVCKTATNMIVTVTPKAIAGKDGKMETITIKSYHCESCRSFIRSTDEKGGLMKKTNFDKYLEEQLKDPAFAARFERAGEAWDVALQIVALHQEAGLSQKDLAKLLREIRKKLACNYKWSYNYNEIRMGRGEKQAEYQKAWF